MEFMDKIMLYCFREVKCKLGFTTGFHILLLLSSSLLLLLSIIIFINCLGVMNYTCISGLMVSELICRYGVSGSFPGRERYEENFVFFLGFFLLNFCFCCFSFFCLMKKSWLKNRRKRFYGDM